MNFDYPSREDGSPNENNDKYVQAYRNYIAAHNQGKILFSRPKSPSLAVFFTGKNKATPEEIFKKAMQYQPPMSEQLIADAEGNYTSEISNTFRDIQTALSNAVKSKDIENSLKLYYKVFSNLNDLINILQYLGVDTSNGEIIQKHVEGIIRSFQTAIKLDKENFFQKKGNFVSFDALGKGHLNEEIKKESGDGMHAKYYNVGDMIPRLSNVIGRQMGLFAEQIGAAILPGFARVQAAQTVTKNMKKNLRGKTSGSKKFVSAFIKSIDFKDKKLEAELKKKVEISGGSPVTDFTFDLSSGKGIVIFNVSAKEYRGAYLKGNMKDQEIKVLATTCHRLLLTAALSKGRGVEQATSYWALIRAAGTAEFMSPKSVSYDKTPSALRKAIIEHFIGEALFGSGDDSITDMIINNTYFSRGYIAKYLTQHNEGIITKLNNQGASARSLQESAQIFIPPRVALDVLNTSFNFYWKADKQNFPEIFN